MQTKFQITRYNIFVKHEKQQFLQFNKLKKIFYKVNKTYLMLQEFHKLPICTNLLLQSSTVLKFALALEIYQILSYYLLLWKSRQIFQAR